MSEENQNQEPTAPQVPDFETAAQAGNVAEQQQPYAPQPVPLSADQQSQTPPVGVPPTAQQISSMPTYYAAPPSSQASGLGTAALVCGILAIVFSATVILGIVLGIAAIVLAGKSVKALGKSGKSTGAKVCGIFGIVFAVLALIIYIASFSLIFYAIDQESESSPSSSYSGGITEEEPGAEANVDAQNEEEVEAAAIKALDRLANPSQEKLQAIAVESNAEFASDDGFELSEIGIDPLEFAEWLTSDIEYTIDSVTVMGALATVEATVTSRDVHQFPVIFEDDLAAYMDSGAYSNLGSESEAMIAAGGVMKESMAKTGTSEQSVSLTLIKKEGVWAVNESSLSLTEFSIYGFWAK